MFSPSRITTSKHQLNEVPARALPKLQAEAARLAGSRHEGAPLAPQHRSYFESRLGHDFSRVRVHTDEAAASSAHALSAKAFATGEDIIFGAGRYRPETSQGRRLLAHELTHVAQQQRGGGTTPELAEARARTVADKVTGGGPISSGAIGGAPPGLYCDPDEDKKKQESPPSSVLPPMPNLKLSTLPPVEWLKLQQTFGSHGQRLSLRGMDDISKEWDRGSKLLDTFGIDDKFKLGFITKQWILNKGLSLQVDDLQSRENPNSLDRLDKSWKDDHPGGWQTPIVPIFDIDWLRSKKKHR